MQKENFTVSLLDIVHLPRDEQISRGLLHTPKEIAQQPETWQTTFAIFAREQERLRLFLESVGVTGKPEQRPAVMLVGAGTSDYIGRSLTLLLRQKWGCEVTACASTDLLPNLDEYVVKGRNYLWISFSRSGDSPEGVAVLEQAVERYPEIAHLIVTCNPKARMIDICSRHQHAEAIVLDDAVNDRSLAMTSSFTNMVVMGHCLAHAWSLAEYEALLPQLRTAAAALLISGFPLAEKLAGLGLPRLCLVGTGPLAAVATESALKVLEMSAGQVKTMSETTLGLRHGPMAALDPETVFICFVSSDARRIGYAADLMREISTKQITAVRVIAGPQSARTMFDSLCDEYLPIEAELPDAYRPIVDVLLGQMLGLCTSMRYNLKPDSPSPGGVINRVVQEFAIYQ